jgi:hypothetical protein
MIKVYLKSGNSVTSNKEATQHEARGIADAISRGGAMNMEPGLNGLGFIIPADAIDYVEYSNE